MAPHDPASAPSGAPRSARLLNRQMLGKLVVMAGLMFGFGYALVPIYQAICEITGINVLAVQETLGPKKANVQVDATRTITVEFDANSRGPWEFRPAQRSIQVHPGELATVMYEFRNIQNRTMAALMATAETRNNNQEQSSS